jgi:restriction endonuclease
MSLGELLFKFASSSDQAEVEELLYKIIEKSMRNPRISIKEILYFIRTYIPKNIKIKGNLYLKNTVVNYLEEYEYGDTADALKMHSLILHDANATNNPLGYITLVLTTIRESNYSKAMLAGVSLLSEIAKHQPEYIAQLCKQFMSYPSVQDEEAYIIAYAAAINELLIDRLSKCKHSCMREGLVEALGKKIHLIKFKRLLEKIASIDEDENVKTAAKFALQ